MSTDIRPELSSKNKWYLDRERYYELKHFCLQYRKWKTELASIDIYPKCERTNKECSPNPTESWAIKIATLKSKISRVENSAKQSDKDLAVYILKAVTEACSYQNLRTFYDMPCSKDMFYDRYRKFFWILDKSE